MLGVGQMESCKNIQLKSLKIEEKWKEKSRKGKKLSHVMLASHVSANSIPGCFLSSSAPHQWAQKNNRRWCESLGLPPTQVTSMALQSPCFRLTQGFNHLERDAPGKSFSHSLSNNQTVCQKKREKRNEQKTVETIQQILSSYINSTLNLSGLI